MPAEKVPTATVFVVDDEHIIATTLALILKDHGFEAKPFSQPHEALQAAQTGPPDVLLSDVIMPGMSGIDLAIQIQKDYPTCKVLLFSGQTATTDMVATAENNGHRFDLIAKPAHPSEIVAKIKASLDQTKWTSGAVRV